MASMLFTFQIILLVIGLGVGYLILVKANTHEGNLKTIGEALGWTLIALTIFLAICNFFYSITILNNYTQNKYCPINSTDETQQQQIQEGNAPAVPQPDGSLPDNGNPQPGEGKPIKPDVLHDHE